MKETLNKVVGFVKNVGGKTVAIIGGVVVGLVGGVAIVYEMLVKKEDQQTEETQETEVTEE